MEKKVLVSNKALFEPQCGYVLTMYFSSPSCNGYRLTLVINSAQFREVCITSQKPEIKSGPISHIAIGEDFYESFINNL